MENVTSCLRKSLLLHGKSYFRSTESVTSCPPPLTLSRPPQANPHNYDAWFDYLRLVEHDADSDTVREVYERAIANIPPIQDKRHWKRYIYLWINYALYEELEVKVRPVGRISTCM